jgi:hypothetical protein
MRRQVTDLHTADRCAADQIPDGLFLVRVDKVQHRWQAQKPYFAVRFEILEPCRFVGHFLSSRLYCNSKAPWKLNWFLGDFGYDTDLLGRDEVVEKALIGLQGVVKLSHVAINGTSLHRLDGFAPLRSMGRTFTPEHRRVRGGLMMYSYTQISQYLTCPRRYRHRYLDGWKEKDTRPAMFFGRAFERALAAYFRREDPGNPVL